MASVERPPDYAMEARWQAMRPSLIDVHPGKRRSERGIREAEERAEAAADRPAAGGGRGGPAPGFEKRRLQLQFQFKGGKALPPSAMPEALEGEVPMSLVAGRRVKGVGAGRRARAAGAARGKEAAPAQAGHRVRFGDDGGDGGGGGRGPLEEAVEAAARSPGRRLGPTSHYLEALEERRDDVLREAGRSDEDVGAVVSRLEAIDQRIGEERARLGAE